MSNARQIINGGWNDEWALSSTSCIFCLGSDRIRLNVSGAALADYYPIIDEWRYSTVCVE